MSARRTAADDQLGEAARDAERVMFRAAGQEEKVPHRPAGGPGLGFAAHVLGDLHLASVAGTLRVCPHLTYPQVVQAAAWRPGEMWCVLCAPAQMILVGDEDRTCDRCRKVYPTIRACMAQSGPVVLSYGLCARCDREDLAEQQGPTGPGPRR